MYFFTNESDDSWDDSSEWVVVDVEEDLMDCKTCNRWSGNQLYVFKSGTMHIR